VPTILPSTHLAPLYVAVNFSNELVLVKADGETEVIAGDLHSNVLPGPTSAAFGRTANDANIIYLTTSGGLFRPINGAYVEGAKIVAFQLNK
jgi:hypothetical protein